MYDLVIIGNGPAGISAGIYAVRYGLDTLILEKDVISGQIASTDIVENYPGFSSIAGMELMDKFKEHAENVGVVTEDGEVIDIKSNGDKKIIFTNEGEIEAKAVIIATGANPRHIGVPGEEKFAGRGVSYCATCDGPFFRSKNVAVIGGGDSAITDALILSNLASKVYVVHRRDELRATEVLQERAFSKNNIEFIWNTVLDKIVGDDNENGVVKMVALKNVKSNDKKEMAIDGVFIYVGIVPNTGFVDVDKTQTGFIMTNDKMETSVEGIYAAGDCRVTPLRQVVTAVSDGAIAAASVHDFVKNI
ncbi:MAG TPA: thioredoxin-disulfide reductase [Methanosarcinaceae archaeon]|nr:thioredoxin-disulfide reductase [Methanosarcinaceae archaeon]